MSKTNYLLLKPQFFLRISWCSFSWCQADFGKVC